MSTFQPPPIRETADGAPRRVGWELEFAGPDLAACAEAVVEVWGGRVERRNAFVSTVVTEVGDFSVEIDADILRSEGYRDVLADFGIDLGEWVDEEALAERLASLARTVVPCEVGTPPLPWDEMAQVEDLREALRRRGAKGTGASMFYAFGLHLNPELPRRDAATALAGLRAFLLREADLRQHLDVDLTRRVTPYIRAFPEAFRRHVLRRGYAPDAQRLIDDYLQHNPTRNRALDLLPALACLDEDRVRAGLAEGHLVSPRPTFHYRLPNCRVDEPGWRLADEWNAWVSVEALAADEAALEKELTP